MTLTDAGLRNLLNRLIDEDSPFLTTKARTANAIRALLTLRAAVRRARELHEDYELARITYVDIIGKKRAWKTALVHLDRLVAGEKGQG